MSRSGERGGGAGTAAGHRAVVRGPGTRARDRPRHPPHDRRGRQHPVLGADHDAVAPDAKEHTRHTAARAAADLNGRVPVCIRINPPGSPWFADDVAALPDGLTAVVVPKWEAPIDRSRP